jgi:hypothetical protein
MRAPFLQLKMDTLAGLRAIHGTGVVVDVIYVDACHEYSSVLAELKLCHALFPRAVIVGDDYQWPDVRRAAEDFLKDQVIVHTQMVLEPPPPPPADTQTSRNIWCNWFVLRPKEVA